MYGGRTEAEKVYNSRKLQLDKVIKNRELNAQREQLEVDLQLSFVQSLTKLKDFRQSELDKLEDEERTIDAVLENARAGLAQQQDELEQRKSECESMLTFIQDNLKELADALDV